MHTPRWLRAVLVAALAAALAWQGWVLIVTVYLILEALR